jgi:DNA-binding SARP family transcriptional activator
MLPPADNVVLAHGRLRLGPRVWVDSHALECLADASKPQDGPDEQAARLLLLYRGPFLMDEDLASVVAARERLRSQFVRLVLAVGSVLRAAARDAVIDLFQRAIEREPLAEPVSCALMAEFLHQGRQAEAVREYHRSRAALAQAWGSPPSAAAQRLFARLKQP